MQKALALVLACVCAGCATVPSGKPDPRDPWERFNRTSFAFNDALDRATLKPAAKVYKKVTPQFVRTGLGNFFSNLDNVSTVINDVLQGKMGQAGRDSARFLMNSTLGLGGLFDPATAAGLEKNDEDFGQTLGKWGVKSGPYLMLPILGPSTVRDTAARLPEQYAYPVNYLEDDSTRYIIRGVETIDMRAGLLELEPQLEKAYDRYAFIRNAWLQRREYQVTDGNIEDPALDLEEGIEEEPAAETETMPEAAPATAPAPSPGG